MKLRSFIYFGLVLLLMGSCKKENTPNPPNETPNDVSKIYEDAGFGYLGRFDTQLPDLPNSYYLTPLDIREVDGKMYASCQNEITFYGSVDVYSGTFENKQFIKSSYEPCGDARTSSDYWRVLNHEFDGQGNLFTSFRYRQTTSSYPVWYHSFCSSSGINSITEYIDYPMDIVENNQIVSAVGAMALYNGYELPNIRYYSFGVGGWESVPVQNIKPNVQAYNYYMSENGNGFLAYTDAQQGDQTDGQMNLLINTGSGWMSAGSVPASKVRKLIVNYFEPYQIRIIRNGDSPIVVLFRDDNTMAVYQFDGVALQLVSDNVGYPSNTSVQFTSTTKTDFCVYQDKLTTYGFGNSTGLIDNPRAIYQLTGNSFQLMKTIGGTDSNITLRGVYSNNLKLWAACEVFRADNGVFTSPIDIIEIME